MSVLVNIQHLQRLWDYINGKSFYGYEDFCAVFQRLMDSVLGDLQPRIAVVCIDNITIFYPMLEQHYEDVDHVLERLSVANLKFNINKCAFACEEVVVLGFKVSKDGINPNPAKVQGINDLKPPKNVSGVK